MRFHARLADYLVSTRKAFAIKMGSSIEAEQFFLLDG